MRNAHVKIFSFVPRGETIHNAAPVAPANPFALVPPVQPVKNPFASLPALQAGPLQDRFTRQGEGDAPQGPAIASFDKALDWLNRHDEKALNAKLDRHLQVAGWTDLSKVAGLLNAAQKTRKLVFDEAGESRLSYHRNFGYAVEALEAGDLPAAKVYLKRARRDIQGYENLGLALTGKV